MALRKSPHDELQVVVQRAQCRRGRGRGRGRFTFTCVLHDGGGYRLEWVEESLEPAGPAEAVDGIDKESGPGGEAGRGEAWGRGGEGRERRGQERREGRGE